MQWRVIKAIWRKLMISFHFFLPENIVFLLFFFFFFIVVIVSFPLKIFSRLIEITIWVHLKISFKVIHVLEHIVYRLLLGKSGQGKFDLRLHFELCHFVCSNSGLLRFWLFESWKGKGGREGGCTLVYPNCGNEVDTLG